MKLKDYATFHEIEFAEKTFRRVQYTNSNPISWFSVAAEHDTEVPEKDAIILEKEFQEWLKSESYQQELKEILEKNV